VRLGRYVAAEVLLLASALAGAGWATRVSLRILSERGHLAESNAELNSKAGLLPRAELSNPPNPAIFEEPAGTFLGMDDEMLLERVRRQPILGMKLSKGGSSLSFRVELADGSRAAFKPAQTNFQTIPRKEVAAYRLNRLLGLNAVPPAAPRMVSRDEMFAHLHPDSLAALPRIRAETIFNPMGKTAGVIMYWVPGIKDLDQDSPAAIHQSLQWLTQGQPIPVNKRSLAAQLSQLVVFDFLTSNPDRFSGGNMKTSSDGSRLLFMDNTMSFFLEPEGNERTRSTLQRTQRFSRQLYQSLDRISVPTLERILAQASENDYQILTPSEIRAVVSRRDLVKRHIETLVASYGSRNVLVFP
jgi:hypothetical protein